MAKKCSRRSECGKQSWTAITDFFTIDLALGLIGFIFSFFFIRPTFLPLAKCDGLYIINCLCMLCIVVKVLYSMPTETLKDSVQYFSFLRQAKIPQKRQNA